MTTRVVIALAAIVVAAAAQDARAARAPSYLERVTIMDAFNHPGRSLASKCVRILVSTADARYAIVTGPLRIPLACQRARGKSAEESSPAGPAISRGRDRARVGTIVLKS
jgi:hypothetical protein